MPSFFQGLILLMVLVISALGCRAIYERFAQGMIHSAEANDQLRRHLGTFSSPLPGPAAPRGVSNWYAHNEPLPTGYKCSGADGIVYRMMKSADGSLRLEPLMAGNDVVRCGGDWQSSHRWEASGY